MLHRQKRYHYIYKTTCQLTGKFYIGMHSTNNLKDGYLGSGTILHRSLAKYGKENHKKEILEFHETRDLLKKREAELVNEELLANPLNINLARGGGGGWDHVPRDVVLRNLSLGNKGWAAYNRSDVGRAKKSANAKKIWSDESFRVKHLHKSLKNLVVAIKNAATQEAINKRKATYAERGHMQGEKNSQFGTCWVTNGIKPVKIKKEMLDVYVANGYRRGRK